MATAARSAARTDVRFAPRTRQQWAIIRRSNARRQADVDAPKIVHQDPAMIAACIEAAGFDEHRAHYC